MSEIVGIGVDMIEISRVLAAYSKESFRKRHFTEEELTKSYYLLQIRKKWRLRMQRQFQAVDNRERKARLEWNIS